jgi:general secretion pathway protein D
MLAGLIRDDERTVLAGVPGLSDLPLIGKLFANNHKEAQQTDIILTLTPHIVRVLDVNEEDLRPFRLGRESGATLSEAMGAGTPPRDRDDNEVQAPAVPRPPFNIPPSAISGAQPAPSSPSSAPPVQPPFPQPLQGPLPGIPMPITTPTLPKKPGGGGS